MSSFRTVKMGTLLRHSVTDELYLINKSNTVLLSDVERKLVRFVGKEVIIEETDTSTTIRIQEESKIPEEPKIYKYLVVYVAQTGVGDKHCRKLLETEKKISCFDAIENLERLLVKDLKQNNPMLTVYNCIIVNYQEIGE